MDRNIKTKNHVEGCKMTRTDPHSQSVRIDGHIIELTHLDKVLWPKPKITKSHYLHYLSQSAHHLLPLLNNRHLTVIRYPHGITGDFFFQKNCPPYAPSFVQTHPHDGTRYIVCSNLATLIWLGNQLALEFHIPFQPMGQNKPSEIVFDLDPPDRSRFNVAVTAALYMKELFDQLALTSFIKTSGNKGLQVYLPLPENTYTYQETRLFTSFIARYLIAKAPQLFTTERLKKKRQGRLYIDYVQHAPGKTIIAPYSPRANPLGTVATPLDWKEVTPDLRPQHFTMHTVIQRLKQKKCPFHAIEHVRDKQPFGEILKWISKHTNSSPV
jgi:bifunctional non-homologous end joining protein LigD